MFQHGSVRRVVRDRLYGALTAVAPIGCTITLPVAPGWLDLSCDCAVFVLQGATDPQYRCKHVHYGSNSNVDG